jgi:general secretion pathway protein C
MSLPSNLSSIIENFSQLPQQKIAKGISVLLLGYIAFVCAQITWFIVPNGPFENSRNVSVKVSQQGTKTSTISLSNVKSLNIFGLYSDSPKDFEVDVAEVENVPETRLNLTLSGVVASDDKTASAAVIENSGKQSTYSPGETITGTRAILDSVFNDRVILKHAGNLETLMLDGFDYSETSNSRGKVDSPVARNKPIKRKSYLKSPNVVDQRMNKLLSKSARSFKEDISTDPSKITDYLKISPKRLNGKVIGYRLMPGKNSKFFQDAGLKSGDVAIQMNGYDLTTPSEAAQAISALKQDKEVSLLIDRNGDMTEILFSIDG